MQQFTFPILLAGITGIIVLLSGLIGGVSFLLIIKRIFIFGLIIGGLGFLIQFLLQRWGIDINASSENSESDNQGSQENSSVSSLSNQDSQQNSSISNNIQDFGEKNDTKIDEGNSSGDMSFDYTVKDDEDIEFKPLDESLLQKNKTKFIDYQGEKIEYDPKKAAQTIRQLLEEDKAHGE